MPKKADCTPEQWQKYKDSQKAHYERNRERLLQEKREYYENNKDAILARTKAYAKTDKARARMSAYQSLPEVKERRRKNAAAVAVDPEVLAIRAAYRKAWKTGVSPEEHAAILNKQGGICGICQNPLTGTHIATDHCHETGLIRGLLCQACNTTEGRIRKLGFTPFEFAQRLHDYLSNPPAADMALFWLNRGKG